MRLDVKKKRKKKTNDNDKLLLALYYLYCDIRFLIDMIIGVK